MRVLERLAIVIAALALSVTIIAVLSGGLLAGRDSPGIVGQVGGLGAQFSDLGSRHLAPGAPHPSYNSKPPTSGAHVPLAITQNGTEINDDQLLEALELGDVVLMYGGRQPPPGLRALAESVAAPFSSALAAAGQAVILARRPGTGGILGLAWTRLVHVRGPGDPTLRSFIMSTLGHGAHGA